MRGVALQAMVVALFELVADWLKHAFMAKFNKLDAHVYDAYADRLARDVVTGRGGGIALDHTHAVTRRLGLAVLPLACIATRYLAIAKHNLQLTLNLSNVSILAIFLALFLVLLELKVLTSVCLAGVSVGRDNARRTALATPDPEPKGAPSTRSSFDDPRFLRSDPKSPTTPSFRAILLQHQKQDTEKVFDPGVFLPDSSAESSVAQHSVRRRTRSEDPPDSSQPPPRRRESSSRGASVDDVVPAASSLHHHKPTVLCDPLVLETGDGDAPDGDAPDDLE